MIDDVTEVKDTKEIVEHAADNQENLGRPGYPWL